MTRPPPAPFAAVPGAGSPAEAYARRLLAALPAADLADDGAIDAAESSAVRDGSDPVADWAASGAMALTAPGLAVTGPVIALRGALLALQALAPGIALPGLELLGERAALWDFGPAGAISCGGATHFLDTATGPVVLALTRPDDEDLVGALVSGPAVDPWAAATAWAAQVGAVEFRDRAVLLGLAAAIPGETTAPDLPWQVLATGATTRRPLRPRVIDLSALWAGPLCAALLGALGCEVIKIEDPARPDGSRAGPPDFFDLHYPGASWAPFAELPALLAGADVVIEASRPRALRQRGIVAEQSTAVWVSITGYGRDQPQRIGYGDDAAVAGGLLRTDAHGSGAFVGDAIADPLTGVHAALAAWAWLRHRRSCLLDISLARTSAVAASLGGLVATDAVAAAPVARVPTGRGPALGA